MIKLEAVLEAYTDWKLSEWHRMSRQSNGQPYTEALRNEAEDKENYEKLVREFDKQLESRLDQSKGTNHENYPCL